MPFQCLEDNSARGPLLAPLFCEVVAKVCPLKKSAAAVVAEVKHVTFGFFIVPEWHCVMLLVFFFFFFSVFRC